MKKLFAFIIIVACSAGGYWFVSRPMTQAPAVTFSTLTGKQLALTELRGKVVLVKFWATSCVTCVAQMPGNIENFKKYNEVLNELHLLDLEREKVKKSKNFVEKLKYDQIQKAIKEKFTIIQENIIEPIEEKDGWPTNR